MLGRGLGGVAVGVERRGGKRSLGMADERVGERQPGVAILGILLDRAQQNARGVGVLALPGEGVGDHQQIQGLFGTPGQGMINVYPTVTQKTGGAWSTPREENYVFAIIDELKRTYMIDTNRIYLAGHSMGGYGTWYIGGINADMFAALSPQAGGGGTQYAENLKCTPTWFYHSTDDPRVESKSDEQTLARLNELKTKYGPYDFVCKIYKDIGHGTPKGWACRFFMTLSDVAVRS